MINSRLNPKSIQYKSKKVSSIINDREFISELMHAIKLESILEVKYLINNYENVWNVNINSQDYDGNTALMLAAFYNTNDKIMQYLCDTFKDTIDVNSQDYDGNITIQMKKSYSVYAIYLKMQLISANKITLAIQH